MTQLQRNARPPLPGHWIPWLIVAGFGVVILANAAMIYLALSSFTGLQTEGSYLRGRDYNRVLAAERAERALGWDVTVDFESTGAKRGRIVTRMRDAAGDPLEDAVVVAHLVRPAQQGHDMDIALDATGAGTHAADVELPLPGLWEIQTQITHRFGSYRTVHRIVAP
ncbi:MAG: FixH family protein [Rhodospirillales bacterium]|nr:MAG: FixH family protein [Rhodospirillales bacterium]